MSVFHTLEDLPVFKKPVITIGSFDGVHKGHKAILKKVVNVAKNCGGESVLITFEPHPRKIIQPDQPLGLLSSLKEKIELVLATGIDHIVVVPFTRDFSMLSAQEYVVDFLYKRFHPHTIIIGYDHQFGHQRKGNIETLRELMPHEVQIVEIEKQLIHDAAVSSTKIRNAITTGNMIIAAEMLERPYSFQALVVHGNKIGRTIGYPTANLQPTYSDILIPGIGIYAVFVIIKDIRYKAMMSIGKRPTVTDDERITLEVNILDFDEDIYGALLEVMFVKYIRGEEKLESLDALKAKIAEDEIVIRAILDKEITA